MDKYSLTKKLCVSGFKHNTRDIKMVRGPVNIMLVMMFFCTFTHFLPKKSGWNVNSRWKYTNPARGILDFCKQKLWLLPMQTINQLKRVEQIHKWILNTVMVTHVDRQCPPLPHFPPQQRRGGAALFSHWITTDQRSISMKCYASFALPTDMGMQYLTQIWCNTWPSYDDESTKFSLWNCSVL